MLLFRSAIYALSGLLLFAESRADIVILGGSGSTGESSDANGFPIANMFSIGDISVTSIPLPNLQESISDIAIYPSTGEVIYVGQNNNYNFPFLLEGSVVSAKTQQVSISPIAVQGNVNVAIDSQGTAIITGSPFVYKFPLNASQAIAIPLPVDSVFFSDIAITSDNTAILVGQDNNTSIPVIYALPEGASELTLVSLPDPTLMGQLNSVAIGPDNTAILAGVNTTDNQALIYRLPPGRLLAEAISIPDLGDEGFINSVAIAPDNTAILVGQIGSSSTPLIYTLSPGSTSASIIDNPNADEGYLQAVAIGSNGIAVMGGADDSSGLPLIYKLTPGASQASLIQLPNANSGAINAVAVGSENIAVFGGGYNDSNQLLVLTLPLSANSASVVAAPITYVDGSITSVAIYSCNGLYDIRRLSPYYYLQLSETINKLNLSGL